MHDEFFSLKVLGAIVFLGLCAALRFDRPTYRRTYTSAAMFRLGSIAYVALQATALVALVLVAQEVMRAAGLLATSSTLGDKGQLILSARDGAPTIFRDALVASGIPSLPGGFVRPSVPLWVALALTLAIFGIPAVEKPVRRLLQGAVGVPSQAADLAKELCEAQFAPLDAVAAESRALLETRGIEMERDWLPRANPARDQLLRATAVYIELRNWQQSRLYCRFVERASNDVDQFRQRFDRVSIRAARAFASIEQVGAIRLAIGDEPGGGADVGHTVDERCRDVVNNILVDLCSDIGHFYSDGCKLLARGFVSVEPTANRAREAARAAGFSVASTKTSREYLALGYAAVAMLVSIGIFFAMFGAHKEDLNLPSSLLLIIVALVGAMAIGAIPKLRWGFASAGLETTTPPAFIAGAGLAALLWIALINVVFGALLLGGWTGVRTRFANGVDFFPLVCTTAMVTGWLVQDHRWSAVASEWGRRLLDAATMGLVWVFAGSVGSRLVKMFSQSHDQVVIPLTREYVAAFLMGALAGAIVPHAFREKRRSPVDRKTARQRTGQAVAGMSTS